MNRISCIIPTLRRQTALERTLRSLEKQTIPPHEVIVVLQADTPSCAKDTTLRLIELRQEMANAQSARNLATKRSEGDLLLFLDDDIEADPKLVETYLKLFEDLKLGVSCGAIVEPGQEVTMEIPSHVQEEPMGWMRFPLYYGGGAETRNFSSCNTCIRRDLHMESGGFDEHFVATIFDDSDWSIRVCAVLASHGMTGRHAGAARATHFREPSGGRRIIRLSDHVKVDAEGWASRLYFWRKNYGWRAWGEALRFARMDLMGKSLLMRPLEWCRAWSEFWTGWRLASQRLASGPRGMLHPMENR